MALDRPVAVVTGANRGLGLETCRQLAASGYSVILTSRREPDEQVTGARFVKLDVTESESISGLADMLRRESFEIDAMINNAGVALDGFNSDVVRKTLAVNFFGAMAVTDTLMPLMAKRGRIVMVSSGLGELMGLDRKLRERFEDPALTRETLVALMGEFQREVEAGRHTGLGWPNSAYRVSKIGLNALTRIVAKAARPRGILVNAVCPGWVRTDMGGPRASTSVEDGAAGIAWAAMLPADGPTGGLFRNQQQISW